MNEDYIKGMKILLQISHENGVNIRKFKLIPLFCQELSEHGVCETFWKEVRTQNTVCSLERYYHKWASRSLRMLLSALLEWKATPQGHKFWSCVFYSLFDSTPLKKK
jgi:hypothetical protein